MLEDVAIFSGLSKDDLELLEHHMVTRSFQKNTIIINEGDEANSFFIIIKGAVKVFLSNEEGKEIIINAQFAGDHFGELALLDDAPRSASVITTEKSTIGVIAKEDFHKVLAKNTDLSLNLIRELTRRVRLLSDNVRSLALMDVYGRVAKILLDMAQEEDGIMVINKRPTQQDIANHIGASREMVARILKDLTTGNYITIDGRRLIINEKLPHAY
ncbi:MAG: Crp/Fnr family transcriptional regulator [Gammaproteobacteria bacterium]|nr:Crp/Fnr family transcriptional regulator [Gammaproteobacteria bacterium]MDH3970936.1 Crp/Fnr family transcriptional regulator [Gammaproteobacteria bacterium]MDH3985096.1 Crp/Fnr family transcriptional regulator [Gammaproteobacteria bacterium]